MRVLIAILWVLWGSSWWNKATAQLQTDTAATNLLFEHFSNENYFNIDNIDHSLYQKLSGFGNRATLIQYQTYYGGYDPVWQDNESEVNSRVTYYGVSYSNQLITNGSSVIENISSQLDTSQVSPLIQAIPKFQLKITNAQQVANTLQLSATVKALDNLPYAEYVIYAAVVEKEVPTSSGGFYRQHVFRKMLPDAGGDTRNRSWSDGDSITINYNWNIDSYVENPNNLGLVLYIQNNNTKTVYQSLSTFQTVVPSVFTPKALIQGQLYYDSNSNCTDDLEPEMGGWMVKLQDTSNVYYAWVDAVTGTFSFAVRSGTYQLEALVPNAYWQTCLTAQVISVASGDTVAVSVAAQPLWNSPMLAVDVSTPLLRRCNTHAYAVSYTNKGSAPAPNATIEFTLDAQLTLDSASAAGLVSLGNNRYRANVGTLVAGQTGRLLLNVFLDCAAVAEQTHCVEAHITCDSSAIFLWSNPLWDDSDISLDVRCDGDSVRFELRNVGNGATQLPIDYFVTEDEIMLRTGQTQMSSGAGTSFALAANAATYYLYSKQSENHPYAPFISKMVEGCGSGTFATGQALQYPLDDNRPFQDVHCQMNKTGIVSTDIQAFPQGYGGLHLIENNTPLEYLLHFQNRGNDTAFTVFVENKLDADLDIESLELGASSHPYRLEIIGGRTLMFIIENANLPHSVTGTPDSRGFIQFRIFPKAGLYNGTLIENQAQVYFNYNPPMATNTTQHQIGQHFIRTQFMSEHVDVTDYFVRIYPNPFGETTTIYIQESQEYQEITLRLFDSMGNEMRRENLYNTNEFQFNRNGLAKGLYFYRIEADGKPIDTGKIMMN